MRTYTIRVYKSALFIFSIWSAIYAQGTVTNIAGTLDAPDPDGLFATEAHLAGIRTLAISSAGRLVFATDTEVLQLAPDGRLRRIAGAPRPGLAGDNGPATSALFFKIVGLGFDAPGNLYVGDTG